MPMLLSFSAAFAPLIALSSILTIKMCIRDRNMAGAMNNAMSGINGINNANAANQAMQNTMPQSAALYLSLIHIFLR